jgi:hypothetical protein
MSTRPFLFAAGLLAVLQTACSSATSTGGGSGGTIGKGGAGVSIGTGGISANGGNTPGSGGVSASGGSGGGSDGSGSGGSVGSGGSSGNGGLTGTPASGGVRSTGGVSADGGSVTGGRTGTGGAMGTGRTGTGGAGTGGATSTGGAAGKTPYKGVANSPAAELAALGATWCYNWGTSPKASECNDPLFVPMVWGGTDVAGAIKAIGNAGYTTVLGFNEPNKTDQANLTVDAAIALWPALTSNPNIQVSSPAVSDDGRAWLESFMTQVKAKGLRVDFIAMHWYGWNAGSCTSGQLEGAVTWASKWGLPVWITEFGCMGSSNPDEQTLISFFNNAIPMLAKHPLVERYAWYPWNTYNKLYQTDTSAVDVMTSLGKAFAAAPQYR